MSKLLIVSPKNFVARIVGDKVTEAAPKLKWALGLTEEVFRQKCRLKAWNIEEVPLSTARQNG